MLYCIGGCKCVLYCTYSTCSLSLYRLTHIYQSFRAYFVNSWATARHGCEFACGGAPEPDGWVDPASDSDSALSSASAFTVTCPHVPWRPPRALSKRVDSNLFVLRYSNLLSGEFSATVQSNCPLSFNMYNISVVFLCTLRTRIYVVRVPYLRIYSKTQCHSLFVAKLQTQTFHMLYRP